MTAFTHEHYCASYFQTEVDYTLKGIKVIPFQFPKWLIGGQYDSILTIILFIFDWVKAQEELSEEQPSALVTWFHKNVFFCHLLWIKYSRHPMLFRKSKTNAF